jgi:hypothetical protein
MLHNPKEAQQLLGFAHSIGVRADGQELVGIVSARLEQRRVLPSTRQV